MAVNCVVNTIADHLIGKAKSYEVSEDKTRIFIPITPKRTKSATYSIAKKMVEKADKVFDFQTFGESVSMNTTLSDGTEVNIHPTQNLMDAYEIKEGNKLNKDFQPDIFMQEGNQYFLEGELYPTYEDAVNNSNIKLANEIFNSFPEESLENNNKELGLYDRNSLEQNLQNNEGLSRSSAFRRIQDEDYTEISKETFNSIFSDSSPEGIRRGLLFFGARFSKQINENNLLKRLIEKLNQEGTPTQLSIISNDNEDGILYYSPKDKNIYLNLKGETFEDFKTKYKRGTDMELFVQTALFEEVIHAITDHVGGENNKIKLFFEGKDVNNLYKNINKLYKTEDLGALSYEAIRMKVQQEVVGYITEEVTKSKNKSLVQKVLDWILSIFQNEAPLHNQIYNNTLNFVNREKGYKAQYNIQDADYDIMYNQDDLIKELGFPKGSNLEQVTNSLLPSLIGKIHKYNSDFRFEFVTDKTPSQVEEGDNSTQTAIYVNLKELKYTSEVTGIPFKDIVKIFINHESAHAMSVFALEDGAVSSEMERLYDIVKNYAKEIPFVDPIRGKTEVLGQEGNNYALSKIHEFVSDAFSNPYFTEYLSNIPDKKTNILERIINTILKFFGQKPRTTIYKRVINELNSSRFRQSNYINRKPVGNQNMKIVYKGLSVPENNNITQEINIENENFDESQKFVDLENQLNQAIEKGIVYQICK